MLEKSGRIQFFQQNHLLNSKYKWIRVNPESATGDALCKNVFLKILQNSQENIRARVSF